MDGYIGYAVSLQMQKNSDEAILPSADEECSVEEILPTGKIH